MLFLDSQDMGITSTLSHPLREVFVLAIRIGIALLLRLGTTYPQEQVLTKILKCDKAALKCNNHRLSAIAGS